MHPNASIDEIAAFLDRLLDTSKYAASEPEGNGLKHRAGDGVSKFAVAVNTSLTAIIGASKCGAQLLVVHHAPWTDTDLQLRDEKMAALRAAGISLYVAHASLDCAPDFGNGWVLARQIGIEPDTTFAEYHGGHAGVIGTWGGTFGDLVQRASRELSVQVEAHEHTKACARVAVVTGAGGDTRSLDEARRQGADLYLTGEGSMYTRMFARELRMSLVFGTHYATEAPGIKALGERIALEAQIPWEFIAESSDVF